MKLLGDDSDEEDQRLKINKKFAAKYESRERIKELARARAIDDDDDESDSESEDDDAELATQAMDVQIVKTINMIRKKDPKIYDKETAWFQQQQDDDDEDDEDDDKKDSKKKKKLYKDVLREQLLEHGPGERAALLAQAVHSGALVLRRHGEEQLRHHGREGEVYRPLIQPHCCPCTHAAERDVAGDQGLFFCS